MKLFQQSIVVQAIVILLALGLLWVDTLTSPGFHWTAIFAMVLILAEGLSLNIILVNANLCQQNSLLPTLLFTICMSAHASTLTPMILVTALWIVCIQVLLLKGSLLTISVDRACLATALIGLGAMIYLPAALMMAGYVIVAVTYRLYNWRDWAVMFLGFAAPFVILVLVLMFTNGLADWWQGVLSEAASMRTHTDGCETREVVGCTVLSAIMLAGVVKVWNLSGEKPVLWQKNVTMLLAFLVGGCAILAATRVFPIDMQLFPIPFTFAVSNLLSPKTGVYTSGRRKRHEWIYVVLLLVVFAASIIC